MIEKQHTKKESIHEESKHESIEAYKLRYKKYARKYEQEIRKKLENIDLVTGEENIQYK